MRGREHGRVALADAWNSGLILAFVTTCTLLFTACEELRLSEHRNNAIPVGLTNPELRHEIGFTTRGETLDVEVPPAAEGLSANQHVDVYRFLQRHKREATGRLTIFVPNGHHVSISKSLRDIQLHVAEAGLDYRLTQAQAHGRSDVPSITLAYARVIAIPPPCDDWAEDVGHNEERIPYPNWGCTTQRNMALMVDNARDLRQPQPEDPRSGEKRSTTWSGYIGSAAKSDGDTASDSKKGATPAKK